MRSLLYDLIALQINHYARRRVPCRVCGVYALFSLYVTLYHHSLVAWGECWLQWPVQSDANPCRPCISDSLLGYLAGRTLGAWIGVGLGFMGQWPTLLFIGAHTLAPNKPMKGTLYIYGRTLDTSLV